MLSLTLKDIHLLHLSENGEQAVWESIDYVCGPLFDTCFKTIMNIFMTIRRAEYLSQDADMLRWHTTKTDLLSLVEVIMKTNSIPSFTQVWLGLMLYILYV